MMKGESISELQEITGLLVKSGGGKEPMIANQQFKRIEPLNCTLLIRHIRNTISPDLQFKRVKQVFEMCPEVCRC